MNNINKMNDFTFKHSDVSGKFSNLPANVTKANFDSRGLEIKDYLDQFVDLLSSINAADYIGSKNLEGIKMSIQENINNLLTCDVNTKIDFEKLTVDFTNLKSTFDQLIISSGESNSEIVTARVDNVTGETFNSLGDRLDKSSSQMEEIETEYNSSIIAKTKGNVGEGFKTIKNGDDTITLEQIKALNPNATLENSYDWFILQKSINEFNKINLTNGKYVVDLPLIYKNDTIIEGISDINTIVEYVGENALLNIKPTLGIGIVSIILKNIQLKGNLTNIAIQQNNFVNVIYDNVICTNFNKGLHSTGTLNRPCVLDKIKFLNNNIDVELINTNSLTFRNCSFEDANISSIVVGCVNVINFDNVFIKQKDTVTFNGIGNTVFVVDDSLGDIERSGGLTTQIKLANTQVNMSQEGTFMYSTPAFGLQFDNFLAISRFRPNTSLFNGKPTKMTLFETNIQTDEHKSLFNNISFEHCDIEWFNKVYDFKTDGTITKALINNVNFKECHYYSCMNIHNQDDNVSFINVKDELSSYAVSLEHFVGDIKCIMYNGFKGNSNYSISKQRIFNGDLISGLLNNSDTTRKDMSIYVRTLTGNDTYNNGYGNRPFKTIQRAIDSIPKYVEHTVNILIDDNLSNNTSCNEALNLTRLKGSGRVNIIFNSTATRNNKKLFTSELNLLNCSGNTPFITISKCTIQTFNELGYISNIISGNLSFNDCIIGGDTSNILLLCNSKVSFDTCDFVGVTYKNRLYNGSIISFNSCTSPSKMTYIRKEGIQILDGVVS